MALEAWQQMEAGTGDRDRVALVEAKMPKRLKKKRPVRDDAGEEVLGAHLEHTPWEPSPYTHEYRPACLVWQARAGAPSDRPACLVWQVGWEEYIDYTFPEEEVKAPSLKILQMAHAWKKQKVEAADE